MIRGVARKGRKLVKSGTVKLYSKAGGKLIGKVQTDDSGAFSMVLPADSMVPLAGDVASVLASGGSLRLVVVLDSAGKKLGEAGLADLRRTKAGFAVVL